MKHSIRIHWKLLALISSIFAFLTGCTSDPVQLSDYDPEEVVICSFGNFLTEEGFYFTDYNDMLNYFDIRSGKTVLVCDKAECKHEPSDFFGRASCNAQLGYFTMAVYCDHIYYLLAGDSYNTTQLRCRDLDGNNDRLITQLQGEELNHQGNGWFYKNRFFYVTEIYPSESFNAESKESEHSTKRLNCVDLDTGKCNTIDEQSGEKGLYKIYKAEKGNLYYYRLKDENFMVYNLENEELAVSDTKFKGQVGYIDENINDLLYDTVYQNYVYGLEGKLYNWKKVFKINIETGEEELIYNCTGEKIGEFYEYQDFFLIKDKPAESYDPKIYLLYDKESGELTELKNSFLNEPGMLMPPGGVTRKGIVFTWAVDISQGEDSCSTFEYRYISMEDLLAGKDDYTFVYRLE